MVMRRVLVLIATGALLAGCGSAAASVSAPAATVGGVGVLPSIPARPGVSTTTSVAKHTAETSGSTAADEPSTTMPLDGPIGERVQGNRLLMIGDSVLASTSRRYTNDMCSALVPLGWQVELDAEVGRFIDFGTQVLDRRLSAGWDAAVVFLGSNYGGDIGPYAMGLTSMVEQLAPIPVVLVTVTEFEPNRQDVNAVIRDVAEKHPNVVVLDWAATSAADPQLLGGDGLHLSTAGRAALAYNVAGVLGQAPVLPGACLPSSFGDDSAGSVVTGTTLPRRTVTPTTQPRRTVTPTTRRPVTATTSRSTMNSASPTTSGGGGTTQPPRPPVTQAPVQPAAPPTATTQPSGP